MNPTPVLCPECGQEVIFVPVGVYRSQCPNCMSLVKNTEIIEDTPPEENPDKFNAFPDVSDIAARTTRNIFEEAERELAAGETISAEDAAAELDED